MRRVVEFLGRMEVQLVCAGIIGGAIGWAVATYLEKKRRG
jgi:hypothetical protein